MTVENARFYSNTTARATAENLSKSREASNSREANNSRWPVTADSLAAAKTQGKLTTKRTTAMEGPIAAQDTT
jgi:hypothetical protein